MTCAGTCAAASAVRAQLAQMASSDVATRNLFVGNIPPECTEEDVQRHFAKYGQITGVKFLPKKSDTIAAFVDFTQVDDARAAHDNHNEILGMKLRTDYNNRPAARGGPSGGPPPPPPPNSYDYDDRGPPPPRYDDRYDDRPRYDDRGPPRYDDRRYDERCEPLPPSRSRLFSSLRSNPVISPFHAPLARFCPIVTIAVAMMSGMIVPRLATTSGTTSVPGTIVVVTAPPRRLGTTTASATTTTSAVRPLRRVTTIVGSRRRRATMTATANDGNAKAGRLYATDLARLGDDARVSKCVAPPTVGRAPHT